MSYINQKIKEVFPDLSVMKRAGNNSLFKGRNLPSFVKDFVLRRYTDQNGNIDVLALKSYLDEKMPIGQESIKQRLLGGESVNITTRFITATDIANARVNVAIPELGINADTYVTPNLLHNNPEGLADGEHWGNITLEYVEPEGRRKGYILITTFLSFEPYRIDMGYFMRARRQFSLDEWIDVLVTVMEYNAEVLSLEQKLEMISRMLPLVEPRLNIIELGPKGTGKSYMLSNMSKYAWLIGGGKSSRAKLFYNKATKQFGVMKYYDVVGIDEIASFVFSDPDEMQSILKTYLEAGETKVDSVQFQSECGMMLMGNIPLTKEMKPQHDDYFRFLPTMFHESATIDRFHGFIEGWKMPRLNQSHIMEGWTLNTEYFSTVMHQLRTASMYDEMFDALVETAQECDLRDKKAIRKMAVGYHKLLFPHILNIEDISAENREDFKVLYNKYCLAPSIARRQIIRQQCHLIDKEFKLNVDGFNMR